MARRPHVEQHRSDRAGWLRAAVLGANDGIVSTAALVVGVAAGGASAGALLATGIAGAVAGAMSMAAGEYVSVKSQADTEEADLAIERRELAEDAHRELHELTSIYEGRGLDPDLARKVAEALTAHDALAAHSRDELGITEAQRARPLQAALASAAAFSAGSLLPMASVLVAPASAVREAIVAVTLVSLLLTGALAAWTGGAPIARGAIRLVVWGSLAMLATELVGRLVGRQLG